eukprot:8270687-Pyramimonas_sp.AAC.1
MHCPSGWTAYSAKDRHDDDDSDDDNWHYAVYYNATNNTYTYRFPNDHLLQIQSRELRQQHSPTRLTASTAHARPTRDATLNVQAPTH